MALPLAFTIPTSLCTHIIKPSQLLIPSAKSIRWQVPQSIRCIGVSPKTSDEIVRRSGNYQPPIWEYDSIQSLNSKYVGDIYATRASKLKEDVKKTLKEVSSSDGLEMIDDLQRLGVFYHFEDEIKGVLESIYNNKHDGIEDGLHATSLKFRLLRQHGYNIPQDVFAKFMDKTGHFRASLCEDIRGMLHLYEASFLSFTNETILDEAREFATKNLEQYLKREDSEQDLALLVSHALELPLHWRMLRMEARWFIDFCARRPYMNPTLLELAKLDFNMVQAIHQEDVKYASRWWNKTGFGEKLSFSRDRLMENSLWPIGQNFKPQFSNFRRQMTIVNALMTTIDDVYDIYGTLDELEAFTNAIERWDISAMEQLPEYMKICFLAVFNSINEIGYDILKEKGICIFPHLQKGWIDLCASYLKEAKWYYSGYKPTLGEYMDNGLFSCASINMLVHGYFLCTNPICMEDSELFMKYPNLVRWSSAIVRLADDLGTSSDEMKRGDVPKSIQCYMHDTGASQEDAREHIKYLIGETWKKINENRFHEDSPMSQTIVDNTIDLIRVSQYMYWNGLDGHTSQGCEAKENILSLLLNPVPLEY